MKVLNIIETAYRATLEEQDDTILWLSQSFQSAGVDIAVLLRGNAVNYLVKEQTPFNLHFGEWQQTHPPELDQDLKMMMNQSIAVYAIAEDIHERALPEDRLIDGAVLITKRQITDLFEQFEYVWHW
ncbi:DsrE family protein [Oscillatoria sp. CS-180]|uniref:DsrE family protein n=1 Tax=Oscillatoria sp. CS-180 TaxID=3021720 RepID=UPI0023302430|nr:DsrE family protein [Oscillatoria sp. CS-180]MDB9524841.1 DsrE family protein [Oscillatoria sp. CS-180]